MAGPLAIALFSGPLFAMDTSQPAGAPLLSPIFSDNMVLQRGRPNAFWGWARPGGVVSVSIGASTATAVAGADGRWQALIPVPPPGGPYSVTVAGTDRVVLQNVLVGDVWLCGGQSNMEFPLRESARGPADVQAAGRFGLRLYHVAQKVAYSPDSAPKGRWDVSSPESAAGFSAVGYYFGLRLQSALSIPIGLIESSAGGSPAESWMSARALGRLGLFEREIAEIRRLDGLPGPRYGSFLMHWLDEFDAGGRNEAWAQPGLDVADWKEVRVPEEFAHRDAAGGSQVWWLRREFKLDRAPSGGAKLSLGEIGKMDTTFINGRWVGASSWVENPRVYEVAPGTLKAGGNVVSIRIFIHGSGGGFLSAAGTLRIEIPGGASVPLAGVWRMARSVDAPPAHPQPLDTENYPTMPSVLYNGMIAPIEPLSLTGAIWYQGEANTGRPRQYQRLLPALIADWRSGFGQGDFPFYIAGLPAFSRHRPEPGTDGWAELREAQELTVRTTPNTGLAVTIDTGEADNIHPREKQVVGDRLAWCALAGHYGMDLPHSGPEFASVQRLPGALRLHFVQTGGGLAVHGGSLAGFAVAGGDRVWHWADARIDHDDVIVSAAGVPSPIAARYAWQSNPEATLFNTAGFPAAPFRTDDWPLGE